MPGTRIRRIWLWRGVFPGDVQLHTGLHLHRYCCRVLLYHRPFLVPISYPLPYRRRPKPDVTCHRDCAARRYADWSQLRLMGYHGAFGK
jgi:hypothetical protein